MRRLGKQAKRTGKDHRTAERTMIDLTSQCQHMAAQQILARGVRDKHVLVAMGKVRCVAFVPPAARHLAYVSTSFLITYVPLALGLVILFQRVTQMET